MRVDLRVKHDVEARKAAIGLFELGHGYKSAAIALSLPAEAVRRWQEIYRAFGSEVLLRMDGKQGRYTYEQKVAAASAVVDGGMTKAEAMAAFGIMSMSPLKKWCALYRRGGAEALRPRPKGRPSGSRAKAEAVAALRAEGHALGHLLACAELKRSTYYYALAHPPRPTRPELREAAAEIFSRTANGCGHRQIAMCLRAEEGAVIADKTVLKMMREMGIRCGIRRETAYHRYNSYRGVVGRTFENVIARDFDAGAPWQKLGTDVTEFKVAGGKAYWAPTLDFCTKEIVASDISTTPGMAQQARMLDELLSKIPEGAAPTMHSDRGWQYQHASYTSRLEAAGIVQSMSRKANCIDNAATEQLFGHVKDEFYRGREWKTFEDFKRDLEEYIVHWNTSRRQVRLKGLTPEEFRNQALAA